LEAIKRRRRSELATPASNEHMFAKAASSGADLVFLDLEDACAPHERERARAKAAHALRNLDWGSTTRAVRMNGVDTRWAYGDVIEVVTEARDALDVIIVPKVRRARDVWWVDVLLTQLEETLGLTRRIGLEVLIEEAEALQNVDTIATASSRLEAIIFGAGDYSASLGARVDSNFEPLGDFPGDIWHYARSRVLVAARAAGIDAIDSPVPNYRDTQAFRVSCNRAATMGFVGKWVIHPSQIETANSAFSLGTEEMARAERVVAAYREAESAGKGATGLDGVMIDAAHVRHAADLERRARLLGLSGHEKEVVDATIHAERS
jgi:citrate lyase subunit beta / citryl-CoA lyase